MNLFRRTLGLVPPFAFVAVLSLPMAQSLMQFAPPIGLGGTVAADPPTAPRTLAAWHDGVLQTDVEAALGKELGLRDWLVRIDNQIRFSLFGVTKRPVVCGPGGWLFEDGYLTSRTHFAGRQAEDMFQAVLRFYQAQEVLREHGVTLVLLVSPSKVETLPEHLPFPHRQVHEAGHGVHIGLLQALLDVGGVNVLDVQRLFWKWRTEEPALPLFPRSGVHWSHVAAARVASRLLDQLEQLSGIDVVNLEVESAPLGPGPGPSEDDMVQMANLLDTADLVDPMPVPVVRPRQGDAGRPQGTLLVSSSFGWLLARYLGEPTVTLPLTMHYYFKSAHDWIDGERGPRREIDMEPAALRAEILRHRFVVVECNASRIFELGYGFPEAVLKVFGMPKKLTMPAASKEQLGRMAAAVVRRTTAP